MLEHSKVFSQFIYEILSTQVRKSSCFTPVIASIKNRSDYICKTLLIISAIIVIPSLSSAKELTDDGVNALMQVTRLEQQLTQVPVMIRTSIDQQLTQRAKQKPEDAKKTSQLRAALMRSLDANIMIEILRKYYKQNITPKEATYIIEWHNSDLGKIISYNDTELGKPENYQQALASAAMIQANQELMDFAKRIDELVGISQQSIAIQDNILDATLNVMASLYSPQEHIQIVTRVNQNRPEIYAQAHHTAQLTLAYSYRHLTKEQRNQYLAYLDHPISKKFNRVTLEGFLMAFDAVMKQLDKEVRKELSGSA